MTLRDVLLIGDPVVFEVDRETRYWTDTYASVPDGTTGVVCGFYDAVIYQGRTEVYSREPGAYYMKGAESVWLSDGRVIPGNGHVKLVDKNEESRRYAAVRDENGALRTQYTRLGDLPSTSFWEEDKVLVQFPGDSIAEEATISRIDYGSMHKQRNDGSPWPFYSVQMSRGGNTSAEESWIELRERGPVYKYYHHEPLSFDDIEQEARFFMLLGHTEEVRNPANDLYSWTKDEVVGAIKDGSAHGFSVWSGLFGNRPSVGAIRYNDEDLGRRVAQATLAGFREVAV